MKKKSSTPKKLPRNAREVPATQAMLFKLKDELSEKILGVKDELKSEIHGVKAEVHGLKSEIHGVKAEVHGLKSEIHRLGVMMEEQNAKNNVVLDALIGITERQDRMEYEQQDIRKILTGIKTV